MQRLHENIIFLPSLTRTHQMRNDPLAVQVLTKVHGVRVTERQGIGGNRRELDGKWQLIQKPPW
jgi:hypothetical protein